MKKETQSQNTDLIFFPYVWDRIEWWKKRVSQYTSIYICHTVFLPMKVAWKQSLKFQLIPLLTHPSSNKHTEIKTPAGYYPIYDRNQQKITPRKVQENNRVIRPQKKLFLVMGFLRLLYALELVGFYPSNMKERIKVTTSNYPFFPPL